MNVANILILIDLYILNDELIVLIVTDIENLIKFCLRHHRTDEII